MMGTGAGGSACTSIFSEFWHPSDAVPASSERCRVALHLAFAWRHAPALPLKRVLSKSREVGHSVPTVGPKGPKEPSNAGYLMCLDDVM